MGGRIRKALGRAFERLLIWVVAMAVALLPSLTAGADFTWNPYNLATSVNQHGAFSELFFVALVAAILAMSNIIDHIWRNHIEYIWPLKLAAKVICVYFFVLILYGSYYYGTLETDNGEVPLHQFNIDYYIILISLLAGAITEVLIAFRNQKTSQDRVEPARSGA